MEIKKEIEKLLTALKSEGWGRKEIEKEFEYNPNYISQALSRGGNDTLLANLQRLLNTIQKSKEKPSLPGDVLNRERAFIKVLMNEMATLMADVSELKKERPPLSRAAALKELKQRTSLVLDDLELEE